MSALRARIPILRALSRAAALLLLVVPGTIHADDLEFDRLEHFTARDGLSQNWVTKMTQDRQGFLWLGTNDGLNRYDGYNFKIYRHDPDDPHSLSNSFIIRVFEDHRGDLWVGTKSGLNRLDRNTGQFDRFLDDADQPGSLRHEFVTDINEDRDGRLWVATPGGLYRFDRQAGTFVQFLHDPQDPDSLGAQGVMRIVKSQAGDLWFGVGGWLHRLVRDQRGDDRFERIALIEESARPLSFYALAEDATGRLWSGSHQGDLIGFDPRTGELVQHHFGLVAMVFIEYIFPRPDGSLWICTRDHGLLVLDPQAGSWSAHHHDPDEPGSLSDQRIMSVFEDRTGILWIATSAGLDKLDPSRERFHHDRHRLKDPNSLSADAISSVAEDRRGDLWVGSSSAGLNRLDHQSRRNTRYRHDPGDPCSLKDNYVSVQLEDSEGSYWFGTDRGIDRFDPHRDCFLHPGVDFKVSGDLQDGAIYDIVESEPGVLWIGGSRGVNRFDTDRMEAQLYNDYSTNRDGFEQTTVYDLEIDQRGDLWIATAAAGLYRLEQRAEGGLPDGSGPLVFHAYHHSRDDPRSLSSNLISQVFEDHAGTLWVATLGGGLHRVDGIDLGGSAQGSEISFTRFREKDGLANDYIMAILEDDDGNLWLSSHQGLTRFDPRTGETKNYSIEDGL